MVHLNQRNLISNLLHLLLVTSHKTLYLFSFFFKFNQKALPCNDCIKIVRTYVLYLKHYETEWVLHMRCQYYYLKLPLYIRLIDFAITHSHMF